MSKKDSRKNESGRHRFQEDFDEAGPDFEEIVDSFTSSTALDDEAERTEQRSRSLRQNAAGDTLVDDSDDDDGEPSRLLAGLKSMFHPDRLKGIGSFLAGIPAWIGKGLAWAGSAIRTGALKAGAWVRRLGSCLVLKGDFDEDEEENADSTVAARSSRAETGASKPEPSKKFGSALGRALKPGKAEQASIGQNGSAPRTSASDLLIDDEDDLADASPWLGTVTKIAASIAVVLVLVGGYVGAKALFFGDERPQSEVAKNVPEMSGNAAASAPEKAPSGAASTKATADKSKTTASAEFNPFQKAGLVETTPNAAQTEHGDPLRAAPFGAVAESGTSNDTGTDSGFAFTTAADRAEPASAETAPSDPWNVSDTGSDADSNSFGLVGFGGSAVDFEATPAGSPDAAMPEFRSLPEPHSDAFALSADTPISMPPLTSIGEHAAFPPPAVQPLSESLASLSYGAPPNTAANAPSELQALQPLQTLRSDGSSGLPPLASSAVQPRTESSPAIPESRDFALQHTPSARDATPPFGSGPSMSGEQARYGQTIQIPDTSTGSMAETTGFPAEEFSRPPMPPTASIPGPDPAIDGIRPLSAAYVPETVPSIPSSGTVQAIAATAPAASAPSGFEPVLGIPRESDPGRSATVVAPTVVAVSPVSPPGASGIRIPGQSDFSAFEPTPNVPAGSSTQPVVPMLPEQEHLARLEPPLGSRLQEQLREQRLTETPETTPQLHFGRTDVAPLAAAPVASSAPVSEGAVLFQAPAAQNRATTQTPLPVSYDDASSSLVALNPTGNIPPGIGENAMTLPAAPPAIPAEANPGYRISMRTGAPAPTSVRSAEATSQNASRFRDRADQEIKRSPTETETYTVMAGDTYMTICDRFFGTSLLYRALAVHNRRRGVAWAPAEGAVIEVPTAEYLQTHYADILSRGGRRRSMQTSGTTDPAASSSVPVSSGQGIRYVVKEGDSVFRIATDQLRDSSRWREIMQWNADRLSGPRDLQPGMEIVLPTTAVSNATGGGRR